MSSTPALSTSAHPMGTPMIEVRGLEKTFRQGAKEIRALRGVDLAVAPGRIHGIIGQSGAGTTGDDDLARIGEQASHLT